MSDSDHLSWDRLAQALTNEVQRRLTTEAILTDLIADLRDICYYGAESDICAAGILAERYEARLREVTDDE